VLLVITGVPGAGKTTLGSALAVALEAPFFSLDAIKESLYSDAPEERDRYELRLAAERELVVRLAAARGTVVVDLWIAPGRDTSRITRLLEQDGRDVVELLCRVPADVAVARYVRRRRGGPHLPPDEPTLERIRAASALLQPMGMGRCIEVDTSGPLNIEMIVDRLARASSIGRRNTLSDARCCTCGRRRN
jgi:predicted kinase